MRNPYRDLHSTRKSRFYVEEAVTDDEKLSKRIERQRSRWGDFYGFMFSDDARQLLPFGHGLDDGFTARAEPSDARLDELIRLSLVSGYGTPRTLEDGITRCVEHLGQQLLEADTFFEIDYLTEHLHAASRPVAFRLGWIPLGTVDRYRGNQIQYVPAEWGDTRTRRGIHYVDLEEKQLVSVALPRPQRSKLRRFRKVMLAAEGQQSTPHLMLREGSSAFDQGEFRSLLASAFLTGTSDVGWSARGLFSDEMLDPYIVWRHLQFEGFKIHLRDAALAGINEMLSRAGEVLNFAAQLSFTGLTTLNDIARAQSDLKAGTKPLTELLRIHA